MGIYINPVNGAIKELFLKKYGMEITLQDVKEFTDYKGEFAVVCLVNNGLFTAAAVMYNEREKQEFTRTSDPRPKTFFLVPKSVMEEGGVSLKDLEQAIGGN